MTVRLARGLTPTHVSRGRVHGRTVTVRLRRAARAVLRIRLRVREHGRSVVTLTRTNGSRLTPRLR